MVIFNKNSYSSNKKNIKEFFNLYFLPSIPCMQKYPPFNSYWENNPHPKQLQPLSSTWSIGFSVCPLEQNRACGSNSLSWFGLNEGQGPQNSDDGLPI